MPSCVVVVPKGGYNLRWDIDSVHTHAFLFEVQDDLVSMHEWGANQHIVSVNVHDIDIFRGI